jgi:ABC-type Fe3+-hydroxamate transport system substrate-binding protein
MITSIDQLNRTLVFQNFPLRIVSLVPSITELLFDLGLNEEVIGITKFCIHPEEWFHSKTRIGGTKNLNIEKIRTLNPDLIIANKEENIEEQINILAEDFPVWVSYIKDFSDAIRMISELSKIVNKEKSGNDIIEKINFEFDNLSSKKFKKISCAYLIWKNPLMTIGGDTFISEMLKYAGFENAFANKSRYPEINFEDLRKAKPEMILLSSEPYPFKEKHIGEFIKELPKCKIFLVDGEMFSWYGSRLLKSASYFSELREKIDSAS